MRCLPSASFACAVLGVLAACSCGGGGGTTGGGSGGTICTGDAAAPFGGLASESDNHACTTNLLFLKGTKPPGAACQTSSDCAPTCCGCPSPGNSATSAFCYQNTCATVEATCCAYASDMCP
jgi:hypothetical protein